MYIMDPREIFIDMKRISTGEILSEQLRIPRRERSIILLSLYC